MTLPAAKSWKKTALWSLSALLAGMGVITAGIMVLSTAFSPEKIAIAAPQASAFPENREALDALAASLSQQGKALAAIAPAAGDRAQGGLQDITVPPPDKKPR